MVLEVVQLPPVPSPVAFNVLFVNGLQIKV